MRGVSPTEGLWHQQARTALNPSRRTTARTRCVGLHYLLSNPSDMVSSVEVSASQWASHSGVENTPEMTATPNVLNVAPRRARKL
jgi:hypothetical protein